MPTLEPDSSIAAEAEAPPRDSIQKEPLVTEITPDEEARPPSTLVSESALPVKAEDPDSSQKIKPVRPVIVGKAKPAVAQPEIPATKAAPPTAEEFFQLGKYPEAAVAWKSEKQASSNHFTVMLMYACSDKSIEEVRSRLNQSGEIFLLPHEVDGRVCSVICWGDFKDRRQAINQFEKLPQWFADNGLVPVVRPIFMVDQITRLSLTRLIYNQDHIKRE